MKSILINANTYKDVQVMVDKFLGKLLADDIISVSHSVSKDLVGTNYFYSVLIIYKH